MSNENGYSQAGAPVPPAGQGQVSVPAPPASQARANAGSALPASAPQPAYQAGGALGSAPAPRKSHTGGIIVIVILALIAVICFSAYSCSANLTKSTSSSTSYAANTVAVITLGGTIQYDGTECSPEGLKSLLDQAEGNPNIKAVVLRVNSGGGTATAGEEMAGYVRDFSKPIVVSSASTNASAAYEISSQADYIYTARTTAIGAIGTVMTTYDLSGLLEKLGVSVDNIASTESKDSSYGTRALTDEERTYYQNLINQINQTFIDNVASGRHLTSDQASALATGMPFSGTVAVTNGVADGIGTLEDACDKAAELAGCAGNYSTSDLSISSDKLSSLLGLLSSSSSSNGVTAEQLAAALKELANNGSTIK
jgi:protease-4